MYNEFEGRTVIDLGCGTVRLSGPPSKISEVKPIPARCFAGNVKAPAARYTAPQSAAATAGLPCDTLRCAQGMLGIGAALLGSAHCLALDIDADALQTAQANVSIFQDLPVSHPWHAGCHRPRPSPHCLSTVAELRSEV